jgi:P4 family phage/plasmid primase-like protien
MTALDLDAAAKWINFLHGNSPGLISIVSTRDWTGRSFDWSRQDQAEAALRYISRLDEDQAEGIYLRVTTLKAPLADGKRGSEEDCLAFGGLWADVDLAGPGHKTAQTLPATFEDATRVVAEAGMPEPTLWIHSGGGLYPWWLLDQPAMLIDPEVRGQIQQMSTTWQQALAAAAKRLGLHYGSGVGDLPRVLRIPGTVNRKVEGAPRQCRFLYEEGRSFTLDELREIAAQVAPEPEPVAYTPPAPRANGGLLPGQDFENKVQWDDRLLLGGTGARIVKVSGGTTYWLRDGASRGTRWSGTTGRAADRDRFYSFSTEWLPFEAGRPYNKFQFYATLHHGGDFAAAARELGRQGYGEQRIRSAPTGHLNEGPWDDGWDESPGVKEVAVSNPFQLPRARGVRDYTTSGAAVRFCDEWGKYIKYVHEEKKWRIWDGTRWVHDKGGAKVYGAFQALTEQMHAEAQAMDEEDPQKKPYRVHVKKLRDLASSTVLAAIATQVTCGAEEFDADTRYLNLRNGVYDTVGLALLPHDPKYMATKMMGASYDPAAVAPDTTKFLTDLLPDETMRDYVLRALGYTLTGEADQRAFFLLHGLPGTGKTQFLEMMQEVFGDYGVTAMASTFHKRPDNGGPNPDLHALRGARFITTSETSQDSRLDEESLKRFTGKDVISTRSLYEAPQEWVPQGTIWFATNHLPKFASDEDAIWRRVKTVNFGTQFSDDGTIGQKGEPNIGRKLAAREADGILALLLSALAAYRADGYLKEPVELKRQVAEHKHEVDPVAQFWDDMISTESVVEQPGSEIEFKVIYAAYTDWHRENVGPFALGRRRFGDSLKATVGYKELRKSDGRSYIPGWHKQGWIIGMKE